MKNGDHEAKDRPSTTYGVSKMGKTAMSIIQQKVLDSEGKEDIVVNAAANVKQMLWERMCRKEKEKCNGESRGCLMDGSVEVIAECSGGEIGDFEYDAGIDLGVVVAEDGCGGGIGGCSNGCSGGCEDDSDIDSLCIEVVAESE
ncbi:Hypothetical predicted protein [Octopus vulgaris]|uniref:Uncharacterized protein n=1 Tax=Octopus vulgaris TaxID=6645 RepID=A0AA36F262_OCTVU|nr:Hypothetical predicted protein [Octopus vulgaris]